MIIELPPLAPETYELFGGGCDGATITIGPGDPYDPPAAIEITDRHGVAHRYEYDGRARGFVTPEFRQSR